MLKRNFHNTTLSLLPRLPYQPKKALPTTSPKPATASQLEELFALHGKPVEMKTYPKPYPPKRYYTDNSLKLLISVCFENSLAAR